MDTPKLYPCANPFYQMYLLPREKLIIRYCPFHSSLVEISDYESMGYEDLCRLFQENEKFLEVRQKFIDGDFKGAGCPDGCEFMAAYHLGKGGVKMEDYLDAQGKFTFQKANLSLGPDCNIRCRYCLDEKNFKIDFGSCKTKFADFVVPFVHNGGQLLLTGGETFLPKWGFVEKLKQLCAYDQNRGSITVFTNGTLLTPEVIDVIVKSPIQFIGISMDTSDPAMFEYIRRGSKFSTVWMNAKALLAQRNAAHRTDMKVAILCSVMKDTALTLEKTLEFYLSQGFDISLNILSRAYFSPDFCEEQSMDHLSLEELQEVKRQLERVEQKWGNRVFSAALAGQLQNVIDKKKRHDTAQLGLGGGSHAPRLRGASPRLKKELGNVKIFVSYHKACQTVESEVLTPIQVGAKCASVRLPMLHDDEGENLSGKNDKFCELTAQYWAWKHCDADYVGFMHYRRHFAFKEIPEEPGFDGVVYFRKLDQWYRDHIGLNDDAIYEAIHGYDIILPTVVDSASWGTLSNEVQFSGLDNLHADAFDKACESVVELDPSFQSVVDAHHAKGHLRPLFRMAVQGSGENRGETGFRILLAAGNADAGLYGGTPLIHLCDEIAERSSRNEDKKYEDYICR